MLVVTVATVAPFVRFEPPIKALRCSIARLEVDFANRFSKMARSIFSCAFRTACRNTDMFVAVRSKRFTSVSAKNSSRIPFALTQEPYEVCAVDLETSTRSYQFGGRIVEVAVATGSGDGKLLRFDRSLVVNHG